MLTLVFEFLILWYEEEFCLSLSEHSLITKKKQEVGTVGIQLTDFYQAGNWMVELDIYGPTDHSVTGLFVR